MFGTICPLLILCQQNFSKNLGQGHVYHPVVSHPLLTTLLELDYLGRFLIFALCRISVVQSLVFSFVVVKMVADVWSVVRHCLTLNQGLPFKRSNQFGSICAPKPENILQCSFSLHSCAGDHIPNFLGKKK